MTSEPALQIAGEETAVSSVKEAPYRVLPHNEEAEQALLGALLTDNRAMERVSDFLLPHHFHQPVHGRIYDAILKMGEKGLEATPVTLKAFFEKDEALEHVGGSRYLADLAANVITIVNARDYAQTIYELHLRRELISLGEDVVNEAYEVGIDDSATSQIEVAEKRLFDLAESGDFQGGFVSLHDSVGVAIDIAEKAHKMGDSVSGVTVGLSDVDRMMGGVHPSDLIILAGRPSMGKTALATNMAFNAARAYMENNGEQGAVVGFFSLEMSSDQLATRILADLSEISGDRIRRGDVQKSDFRKFIQASQTASQIPLFIDDTPALSINAVRTRARRLKRQHNLGMLVIDYLQLLRGTGSKQSENRVQEISEITRGLKAIAKELHIPVLALSQLSRQVESREDKRPMLSDLRESGSIEQDADVVMFVYREEYYLERSKPDEDDQAKFEAWQHKMDKVHNTAECIISKQRHGPVGTVNLSFNGQFTRFSDLAPDYYEER